MENQTMVGVEEDQLAGMSRLLEEEGRLYGQLLELARQKQQVLVQGRLERLEQLLGEEQASLQAVSRMEEERYALQCDLARRFGLAPGELTVSKLAELAGADFGPRLRQCQQGLVRLIQDLSAVNQTNMELIQQSLAYVNFAVEAIAGGGASVYGEGGQRRRRQVVRLFNGRA